MVGRTEFVLKSSLQDSQQNEDRKIVATLRQTNFEATETDWVKQTPTAKIPNSI
jgi:hypothetical protein